MKATQVTLTEAEDNELDELVSTWHRGHRDDATRERLHRLLIRGGTRLCMDGGRTSTYSATLTGGIIELPSKVLDSKRPARSLAKGRSGPGR